MFWKMNKPLVFLMLITATWCMPAAVRDSGRSPTDGSAGERSEDMNNHQYGEQGKLADGTKYQNKEKSKLAHQFKDEECKQSGSADDVRQEEKGMTDGVINKHKDSNQSTHKDNHDHKEVSQSPDEVIRRKKESNQSPPRAGHHGEAVIQSSQKAKNQNKQSSQSGDDAKRPDNAQQRDVLADKGKDANPASTDNDSEEDKELNQSAAHQNNKILPQVNKNQNAKGRLLPSKVTGKGKDSSKDSIQSSTKKVPQSTESREEDKRLTLNQKLERYVALYKLTDGWENTADINEKDVLRVLSSIASSHDLTEEELAELICAILCGLGTCPPSCPGYYEPPWGPSENLTLFDVLDR